MSQVKEITQTNKQRSPYILLTSFSSPQAFLIIDRYVVMEIVPKDVPVTLLSAFFPYNICYTIGCGNFYAFLEHMFLKSKNTSICEALDCHISSMN